MIHFAALLLAAIGLQAAPSGVETFEPRHGSAFSASTVDVALASTSREVVANPTALPQDLPPPPLGSGPFSPPTTPLYRAPAGRPDALGYVAADVLLMRVAPRPPPLA